MVRVTLGFSVSVCVSLGTHCDVGKSTSLSQLSQGANRRSIQGNAGPATRGAVKSYQWEAKRIPQREGRLGLESTCSCSPKIYGFSFTMQIQGFIRK